MENPIPGSKLIKLVATRAVMGFFVIGALFFLPAGTLDYWQAWAYLTCLFLPMVGVFFYLLKNDPQLMERRMRYKEKVKEQTLILWLSLPVYLSVFILPGFDKRFGWSHMPVWIVIAALAFVLLGYGIFFLVLRENSYASRIVEVMDEQKVISSGPYAIVHHPMYLGVGMLYMATPLALGSGWSFLPALLIVPALVARILNEEKVLLNGLGGYEAYMEKVKYRLIPGLW